MHTILVADDSVTIQRAVEIVFDKEPFTVVKAGSGQEAIARVRETKPSLVIADHTMPDQSGYDLAAALKADPSTSSIPVLLLSATASPYDQGKGDAAGITGFVNKPFDCATLLDRVRTILGVEATPPGATVTATTPAASSLAGSGMPRPPSLGSFTGLPRPPGSGLAPRPPSIPPTPAAVEKPRDPFGIDAALSQPPAPATPAALSSPSLAVSQPPEISSSVPVPVPVVRAETPAPTPLSSPAVVTPVAASGWQTLPPSQALASAPTPMPMAGIDDDLGSLGTLDAPKAPAPAPTPEQAAAAETVKLDLAALSRAAAAAASIPSTPTPQVSAAAVETVVAAAAPAIAAVTGEAPSREALSTEARAIIERIAWEVVPELAEAIIKEELKRLLKA